MSDGCEKCLSARKWTDGTLISVATFSDGPTFLRRCRHCDTLWQEILHDLRAVSLSEAKALYPAADLQS